MSEFQVHKQDISQTRLLDTRKGNEILDGQIKIKIEAFSFTANNITYWAMGDKLAYWQFFPASVNQTSEWGIIPVWGFAEVVESTHTGINVGERLFGYLPTANEWLIQPVKTAITVLFDGSSHRSKLPPGYNMYRRVQAESGYNPKHDALRMLLFPLHITSFCIHDMLSSQQYLSAEQIIILSASSKTSLGLAYALQQDESAPTVVAMTSARNLAFVKKTGYYQQVISYDDMVQIDGNKKSIIIDMSGNGDLITQLHAKLKDNMLYSSQVGLTHWDETAKGTGFIANRSKMFFAPSHIQQRYQQWGAEKFEQLANEFMHKAAIDSQRWLKITTVKGLKGLSEQFNSVCHGQLPPEQGLIIQM
ncbi:DUF2855 family protein [Marinicella litoralis]|uniref:Uncharacterized protein DUF2855 n=1 Tax=Marinicella litoralis TaxID=644220 RepID=A0A4R6Y1G3_9GAMM|nr:DUF2855 family protein [Marinicella litoralis]TDR22798.1 uncharacterized protein DUF2855 [Marinicella litoralis]